MPAAHTTPGIDQLLSRHRAWIADKRIGLVTHTAAVSRTGALTAELLHDSPARLCAIMAPEHGFFGSAAAGVKVASQAHPDWKIPVYSLYGDTRKPTRPMLKGLDAIVFDLQDIGCRAYTYSSTLRLVLEAAAETGLPVIVLDRPVPLARSVDGPVTEAAFTSFVAQSPLPLAYGMTPGETARWMVDTLNMAVDLRIAQLTGLPDAQPQPWLPPSPAMLSWDSARCFPATVGLEALGAVDHGRRTRLPFQLVGARWIDGREFTAALNAANLRGVSFHACRYETTDAEGHLHDLQGTRMTVHTPGGFRPALTALHIVATLQQLYGQKRLWTGDGARPEFFDKLWGTDSVRKALRDGASPDEIAAAWSRPLARFRRERSTALLYPR